MIRPIDIRLNAAHPELPLCEAVTFTGSPSTVLIRGVPPNYGRWAITAVFVAASFPDGSTTTRAAVQSANGVWVATLPTTATSGRTANGLRVMADGIDENGEAVTGYILGVADFAVASLNVTPAPEPGETSYQMLYFDEVPSVLRKGDVAKIDGVLKFYNGSAWEPFAAPPTLDDAVTRTSANGVKSSGIWSAIWGALAALPTGFSSLYDWCVSQLAGKLSTSGGTVTGDISMTDGQLDAGDVRTHSYFDFSQPGQSNKYLDAPENSGHALTDADISDSSSALGTALAGKLDKSGGTMTGEIRWGDEDGVGIEGNQERHRLQISDYDDENAVYIKPTRKTDNASLASLKDIAPAYNSSTAYVVGQLCIKNDALVKCTTAGTGNAAVFSEAYVEDILAALRTGKADVSAIPYTLVTKIISNNAVTLDDRAINAVAVSSALASLTVNFPTATSGKARDFGLRLTVASGITTAPELALPQGVTCENADGTAPEIGADGAATILYFTETASGVFLVKGEVVTAIS